MQFDLSAYRRCDNDEQILQLINEDLRKCSPDDPPFLTDLITGVAEGSQPVLKALAELEEEERDLEEHQIFRWKIEVMRDEWGSKPKPGDYITINMQKSLMKKSLDGEVRPIPGTDLSRDIQRGAYSDKYVKKIRKKIDEKGCVTVGYRDAVHLINCWGIHPITGYAICRKEEQSSGPVRTPDGQMKHVWYWRYREVLPETYAQMSKLTENKQHKTK